MPKKSQRSATRSSGRPEESGERDALLKSLRAHGQVLETADPDAPLGPGQTHVHVRQPGEAAGKLIEKRKSFFKS